MTETEAAEPVDLLAVGGGMAGLSAAAFAARSGARVALVDRAPTLGGSAVHAGFIWSAASYEAMRAANPLGDPDLSRTVINDLEDGVRWIESLGVACKPPVGMIRYGRGRQFDTNHYLARCHEVIRESGGQVLTATRATALITEGSSVRGAELVLADGTHRRLFATWTLLATGGFQGDEAMRAELIHPNAAGIQVRGNPYSDGAGIRLGLNAGGVLGRENAGFYGHLVPRGVRLTPDLYTDLALYYSEHALLFNLDGERFVDETIGDHVTTIHLLEQRDAAGLLVGDAKVYRQFINGTYVEGFPPLDKFRACARRGARCAVVDSLEEFDLIPEEWGYPGPKIRAAIEQFNRDVRAGRTEPARTYDDRTIDEPPFYVVETTPAITFTMTGLLIDTEARVRREGGGVVPGLLAAGADAGGLYHRAYAGGLSPALVFGLRAARQVTAAPSAPSSAASAAPRSPSAGRGSSW